jgi:hypothetical protein
MDKEPDASRLPRRRSSPSFVAAVLLVVVAVGGYAAWRIWFPPPGKRAERIVRTFVRDAAREVGAFRRAMRDLRAEVEIDPATRERAVGTIDAQVRAAVAAIEAGAEEALRQLEEIDDLAVQTHRNRVRRVRMRVKEATDLVAELAAESKGKLQEAEDATPKADS